MIQKKPINAAHPCLQRMLLWLWNYDYTIQYKPGKEILLADHLSWFPSQKENMPIELHQNIHNIHFTPDKLNKIRGAVERDPIHSTMYWLTLNSWPERVQEVTYITHTLYLGYHRQADHRKWYITERRQECVYLLSFTRGHSATYTTTIEELKWWDTCP